MNIIGEIGNFIIIYQEPILAAVLIAVLAAGIVLFVKIYNAARKKREILSQINESVTQIHETVKDFYDKKTEVIYIDGRVTPSFRTAETNDEITIKMGEGKAVESTAGDDGTLGQAEVCQSKEETIPPSKYFSRECGISKDGKRHTVEELNEQIKD